MIFSEFKALLDLVEKAKEFAKENENEEFSKKLSDIYDKMMVMKKQISELQDKNTELEKQLSVKDEIVYGEGAYFKKLDDGEWSKPLCKMCYENDKRQSYLEFKEKLNTVPAPARYICRNHKDDWFREDTIKTPDRETPKRP